MYKLLIKMKKILKVLFLPIFSIVAFSSCEKYDYYSDVYRNNGIQYESAFTNYVGSSIAPDQTWGFKSNSKLETRSAYPNSNMWEDEGYVVPDPITNDEIERVKAVFAEQMPEGYTCTSTVDWDSFFVQHVWKGTDHYQNGYGQDVIGSDHMDWLCSYSDKELQVISWYPYEEQLVDVEGYDDHIYNFNSAYGSIQLMCNTTTKRFGFHNSEDNMIHYNFRMVEIDGAYYVGFDFEGTLMPDNPDNLNTLVPRNWVFDDWIVKICPGKGSGKNFKRIIVEDLVATNNLEHLTESDWDYNDAVFDVYIEDGVATIVLQAAGGTLPLYVGGKEVHEMFGVNVKVPVNVGTGVEKDTVTFTINVANDDINNIPVIVHNKGEEYELLANIGQAPAKICVGTDYEWCSERQHIKQKYPKFVEWSTRNPMQYGDNYWYR